MRALLQCEHFVVRITETRSSINFMDDLCSNGKTARFSLMGNVKGNVKDYAQN